MKKSDQQSAFSDRQKIYGHIIFLLKADR